MTEKLLSINRKLCIITEFAQSCKEHEVRRKCGGCNPLVRFIAHVIRVKNVKGLPFVMRSRRKTHTKLRTLLRLFSLLLIAAEYSAPENDSIVVDITTR